MKKQVRLWFVSIIILEIYPCNSYTVLFWGHNRATAIFVCSYLSPSVVRRMTILSSDKKGTESDKKFTIILTFVWCNCYSLSDLHFHICLLHCMTYTVPIPAAKYKKKVSVVSVYMKGTELFVLQMSSSGVLSSGRIGASYS